MEKNLDIPVRYEQFTLKLRKPKELAIDEHVSYFPKSYESLMLSV